MVDWEESWDKLLAQNLPFRIFLKGRDLTYLACNESYAANHGMKPSEIFGRSDYDLYPRELAEKYRAEDLRILETGLSETIEGRYVKDGQERHGQTIKSLFRDQSGKVIGILGTFWDISELKQAEEALQKSTQLLSDTGEMAQVGGWELDLLTNEVSWTEEVSRIHGVEPGYRLKLEEALNFYPPQSRPAVEEALKKAAETGEPYDLESLFIPSGSKEWIWVRSLGRAVYSDGKITKLAGTFQNIDKYKRAEEKLRESEARFRRLFDQSPIGAAMVSLDNRFLVVNEALCRITGYSAEELTARSFVDITHPDDISADVAQARQLEAGEIDYFDMDKRYLRSDGSVVWIHLNVRMIRDENGRAVYFLPTVEDITARKQAEEALRESEEKYRSVFNNFTDLYYQTDMQGLITNLSPSCFILSGWKPEELIGRQALELYSDPEQRKALLEKLHREGAVSDHELTLLHRDGRRLSVSISSHLIRDKQGNPEYVEGTIRDITERK
ncbi:MAG: PAS domain S-box protein, partial [bacterium]